MVVVLVLGAANVSHGLQWNSEMRSSSRLEQGGEKLAMNENESGGGKKKKCANLKVPLLAPRVCKKCCLKCELKLAGWLSWRTLVLAFGTEQEE